MELFFLAVLFVSDLCAWLWLSGCFANVSYCNDSFGWFFGLVIEGDSGAYFIQDGPVEWLTAVLPISVESIGRLR